jgi:hypothetical protein
VEFHSPCQLYHVAVNFADLHASGKHTYIRATMARESKAVQEIILQHVPRRFPSFVP